MAPYAFTHDLATMPGHGLGDGPVDPHYRSGSNSSLLVAADVADDVGDVFVALFLVGDEGRIVVVIVVDGLVDLDVVFGLRHDGLDLAGVLLGIGLFQRDRLFGLGGLRRIGGDNGGGGSGSAAD